MFDLLHCCLVQLTLGRVEWRVAYGPGAGDIGAIAVWTDKVRVEGDDVALLGNDAGGFGEPGVGMLAHRKQARLDPLAARADILIMKLRPDFLFGLAGRVCR